MVMGAGGTAHGPCTLAVTAIGLTSRGYLQLDHITLDPGGYGGRGEEDCAEVSLVSNLANSIAPPISLL